MPWMIAPVFSDANERDGQVAHLAGGNAEELADVFGGQQLGEG
jgi:hypothetical protein